MGNNTLDNILIEEIYKKYQSRYNISLPKIQNIKRVNNSEAWARFVSDDLYNKKYILYIDKDLLNKNKKFIKQILYHEFTHLADSLNFLNKTADEFKNIMSSYSEFHASKREMVERLEEIDDSSNISLHTEIIHAGILTIESFMGQSFELMKKDLVQMSSNTFENFYYNTNHIYYFYGFVKALQCFNIDYPINIFSLPSTFLLQIEEIQKILLSDNIIMDKLIVNHLKLEDTIKNQCIINKILNNTL